MGIFTGGIDAETITPTFVSPSVLTDGALAPGAGATPSSAAPDRHHRRRPRKRPHRRRPGADLVNGGDGDDTILWNPGGGSDTVDGGAGRHDTLQFNTANIAETNRRLGAPRRPCAGDARRGGASPWTSTTSSASLHRAAAAGPTPSRSAT
jgi:hypothetical protein